MGGAFFRTKTAVAAVASCWALSVVVNGPQFFWADVIETRRAKHDCTMPHVDATTLKAYAGTKSAAMFFTPLVVTWISYCSIIVSVLKRKVLGGYRPTERGGLLGHTETVLWAWRASADVQGDCSR